MVSDEQKAAEVDLHRDGLARSPPSFRGPRIVGDHSLSPSPLARPKRCAPDSSRSASPLLEEARARVRQWRSECMALQQAPRACES